MIDTAQKRASAIGVNQPQLTLVIPDSEIDQGDRQTIVSCYRGILAVIAKLWTVQPDAPANWVDQGDSDDVWTDQPDSSSDWTEQ